MCWVFIVVGSNASLSVIAVVALMVVMASVMSPITSTLSPNSKSEFSVSNVQLSSLSLADNIQKIQRDSPSISESLVSGCKCK